MKTLLLILTLPICLIVNAQENKPFMVKSFPKETIKSVMSKTSGGNIEMIGGSNAEARVEVYVNANNRNRGLTREELTERLAEYDFNIGVINQQLIATAKPKDNIAKWKNQVSISFKIFVPRQVSSDLKTSGGNLRLANLNGVHNIKTSGGNIQVSKLMGNVQGKTSGGNIDVSDTDENINLETSGGNISAQNCKGTIKLRTSGGNLDLGKLNGTITATTSGGNIQGDQIQGELITGTSGGNMNLSKLACNLDASVSSGAIQVEVVKLSKFIKIRSGSGNVNLQIPDGNGLNLDLKGDKVRTNSLKNFNGVKTDERIEGKLNGGGIPVEVHVSSGNINLDMK
ncbi:MAG: hypothetical protein JWN56_1125 [Sphingobacteriales bacterium]|nr:hypothetical protein [Sphingobacteriales bacterium]